MGHKFYKAAGFPSGQTGADVDYHIEASILKE